MILALLDTISSLLCVTTHPFTCYCLYLNVQTPSQCHALRAKVSATSQALWAALSCAAATCYAAAGRRRNAALLRAEVAITVCNGKCNREAMAILASQSAAFLGEGWFAPASMLLSRLLAAQKELLPVRAVPCISSWLSTCGRCSWSRSTKSSSEGL